MPDTGLDACLRLVADRRRRELLRQLRHDADGESSVDEVIDRLWRDGSGSDRDEGAGRRRLAIQLHHSHLPQLADHGVVEYDRERSVVRYCPDEQLEVVLDALPEHAPPANS